MSCVVVVAAACGGTVQAQSSAAADPPATAPVLRVAERAYVDASFGYSIRPFADCEVVRQKRTDADGNLELAQFSHFQRNWMMTVVLSHRDRPASPDDVLATLQEKLRGRDSQAKILRRDKTTIAARPAILFAAAFSLGKTRWLRQEAVVFRTPDELFLITFDTPEADRDVAEGLFDEMVRSFEILRSELVQQQLDRAMLRGEDFLRSLARSGRLGRDLIQEHYLRLRIEGKDKGYLWIREFRTTVDRREGVGLRQETWVFEDDTRVRRQLTEVFLAGDMTFERWNTMTDVVISTAGGLGAERLATFEQGMRQDDKLLVAFSETANAKELKDKAIQTPEAYAPMAVLTFFPRLVDLSKPDAYAFVCYDSERRGLILRAMRVLGPQEVTVEGRVVRAIRIEDSEGLVPPASELHVDEKGRLVKVTAGNLEMIPATPEQIAGLYRGRVEATLQALRELEKKQAPPPKAKKRDSNPRDRRTQ